MQNNLVSKHQLELVLEFIEKYQEHFTAQSGSLVHGDIYLDNVLVDPASYKITGLIDFEDVESNDSLIET